MQGWLVYANQWMPHTTQTEPKTSSHDHLHRVQSLWQNSASLQDKSVGETTNRRVALYTAKAAGDALTLTTLNGENLKSSPIKSGPGQELSAQPLSSNMEHEIWDGAVLAGDAGKGIKRNLEELAPLLSASDGSLYIKTKTNAFCTEAWYKSH